MSRKVKIGQDTRQCPNEFNHNRRNSNVSRFKTKIYLLNEGLSDLVEVGIEGHLNLKARRLNVYVRDGVLGEAYTISISIT